MKVLVLGGYGAVGGRLVTELRHRGSTVVASGRDPDRADLVIDLREPGLDSYRGAAADSDVVVNATGLEDIRLAELATTIGAAFVDVTATAGYIDRLEQIRAPRPIVLNVGLAPGLTNILAAQLHRQTPGPIDIAVFLGAGEKHGDAATEWSYRLLGRTFRSGTDTIRNYTQPLAFDLPGYGRRRMYRVDFSDQHILAHEFDTAVRTYFALDSRLATSALAALTRLPAAARATRHIRVPGSERWLVLARARSGESHWARGENQSQATALLTVAAVERSTTALPGVHHLHRILPKEEIPIAFPIEFGSTPP
ncbi:hypothetical protein [Nocardia sp. NPDC004604]|uniref:hypothetical protein n=1 Tax=Nocardia sp. NPDC004604 TaxID=3157013 RepID=UPI0033AEB03F